MNKMVGKRLVRHASRILRRGKQKEQSPPSKGWQRVPSNGSSNGSEATTAEASDEERENTLRLMRSFPRIYKEMTSSTSSNSSPRFVIEEELATGETKIYDVTDIDTIWSVNGTLRKSIKCS